MLAAVTAILPNGSGTAQRHEVIVGPPQSEPSKHTDLRAFGGRRFATAEARQRANERLMPPLDRVIRRGRGSRLAARPAGPRGHAADPATGSRPCGMDLTLPF